MTSGPPLQTLPRSFRIFLVARLTSLAGSVMAPIAITLGMIASESPLAQLGFVLAARSLGTISFVLGGGVLADRFPRKLVLASSSGIASVAQGLTALTLLQHGGVGTLIALQFVAGACSAMSGPAARGLPAELLADAQRLRGNAVLSFGSGSLELVGPATAGLLIWAFGASAVLALDAASYAIAAILYLLLPRGGPALVRQTLLSDFASGWRSFTAHRWIAWTVACFAVLNFLSAGALFTIGPILLSRQGVGTWGLLVSSLGVGLVTSSWLLIRARPGDRLGLGQLLMAVVGVLILSIGLGAHPAVTLVLALLSGAAMGTFNTAWDTELQTRVPSTEVSRIASFDDLGSLAAVPMGQVAAVPALELLGASTTLVCAGVVYIVVACVPLTLRSVRNREVVA